MSNPSKERGTRFETAVCRYMRGRLGDERIERRALHGNRDMGDLHGLWAHGWQGIVECKSHNAYGPSDLLEWRDQTVIERGNADADFALLVVRVPNVPVARSRVHVTIHDLGLLQGPVDCREFQGRDDAWVSMTLDECCELIGGASD